MLEILLFCLYIETSAFFALSASVSGRRGPFGCGRCCITSTIQKFEWTGRRDGMHFGPKCTFVKSSHFRHFFLMIEKLLDECCWNFVANHLKKLLIFVKKHAEFPSGNRLIQQFVEMENLFI